MGSTAGTAVRVFLSPPSPEAVREAMRDVYADGSIQRVPSGTARPPGGLRPSATRWDGVGPVLLYGIGGVLAVLLLVALVRWARERRPRPLPPDPAPPPPGLRPAPAPLEAADALAAAGRYTEAVHALLLALLRTLTQRSGVSIPDSLTSREILGRVSLEPTARASLSALVLAVETSHFGGRAAGRADYDAALVEVGRCSAPTRRPGS